LKSKSAGPSEKSTKQKRTKQKGAKKRKKIAESTTLDRGKALKMSILKGKRGETYIPEGKQRATIAVKENDHRIGEGNSVGSEFCQEKLGVRLNK